jgi:hypothetical protein
VLFLSEMLTSRADGVMLLTVIFVLIKIIKLSPLIESRVLVYESATKTAKYFNKTSGL